MRSLVIIACFQIAGPALAQSPQPALLTRDASLINAFEIMCNLELPDFDHIDAHAAAMRMKLLSDSSERSAEDTVMRRKAWIGGLTTGPFFLYDDKLSGSKGVSTACAVVGPVPDVNIFRAEAMKELKLPTQPQPEFASDGSRSFVWKGVAGPGTSIILRDLTPSKGPGVMLKILSMVERPT